VRVLPFKGYVATSHFLKVGPILEAKQLKHIKTVPLKSLDFDKGQPRSMAIPGFPMFIGLTQE